MTRKRSTKVSDVENVRVTSASKIRRGQLVLAAENPVFASVGLAVANVQPHGILKAVACIFH
jgi:hypothetical protein